MYFFFTYSVKAKFCAGFLVQYLYLAVKIKWYRQYKTAIHNVKLKIAV